MPKDKIILVYVQEHCLSRESECVDEECNLPLGILYLGTRLSPQGLGVLLMDTRLEKKEEFIAHLGQELADACLVGFSVTTPFDREALELSRFVKERAPGLRTVWGGAHASLFPAATIASPAVDYVITGDAEESLVQLSRFLLSGSGSLEDIANLFYKKDDGCIGQGRKDEERGQAGSGACSYDLLPVQRYVRRRTDDGGMRRQIEVLASRGCPHHCSFCINTVLYHNRWYGYPVDEVLRLVDSVIRQYKVTHIFFMDEDFFCERLRAEKLVEELSRRMITWEANCCVKYIRPSYIDDSFLRKIRESGCVRLRMGLESGSPRILDMLTKGVTVAQSRQAVKMISKAGITPSASFMMGIPGETRRDILKTLSLIADLAFMNPGLHLIGPIIFRPYPGSELFQACLRAGLKEPQSLEEWSGFYMHQQWEDNTSGLPWFKETWFFRRVWIYVGHLPYMRSNLFLRTLIYCQLKLHLLTGLRFIGLNAFLHKMLKKAMSGFSNPLQHR